MRKIIWHPHYVYITIPKPRSSRDISINSKLKAKLNIVQKFQYIVKIEAFTKKKKKNPKKYLESKLNCKKFQGTSPTCLVYHPKGQTI